MPSHTQNTQASCSSLLYNPAAPESVLGSLLFKSKEVINMNTIQAFTKQGMFPGANRQVTFSNENQSRSESAVAINPVNPQNIICVSKKFTEPDWYWFSVEPMVTTDGGYLWNSMPLPKPDEVDGWSDPVVAFDHQGTAYLVAEPITFISPSSPGGKHDIEVTGMHIFTLPNGGSSWSSHQTLIVGREPDNKDDKPWIACDRGEFSPWKGYVYVAWGMHGSLRIARSKNGGATWIGAGDLNAGANVPENSYVYAPEVSVDNAGVVHIVWHNPGSTAIRYTRSTDGGETFEPARSIVNGMRGFRNHPSLPWTGNWPEFPGAKFRIVTLCTGCAVGNRFLVAWSDMREGHARIYYHYSDDSGVTWAPSSGQPLYPDFLSSSTVQHFHPQMIADGNGVVACACYSFGQHPPSNQYRIKTLIMGSFDGGTSFGIPVEVSDIPWDPAVNAPWAHSNPNDTFIGEYFGLDGGPSGFAVIWTDTRTGVQELFYDYVSTSSSYLPFWFTDEIVATILTSGVGTGGGGLIIVGGKIVKVPPRSPRYALLQTIATLDIVQEIDHPIGQKLVQNIGDAIEEIAKDIAIEK